MNNSKIIQECGPDTYTVITGEQQTCFDGVEAAADQVACLHSIIEGLRQDRENLRAAVLSMRNLWPAERWATLSGICRDHPCIDEMYAKAKEKR